MVYGTDSRRLCARGCLRARCPGPVVHCAPSFGFASPGMLFADLIRMQLPHGDGCLAWVIQIVTDTRDCDPVCSDGSARLIRCVIRSVEREAESFAAKGQNTQIKRKKARGVSVPCPVARRPARRGFAPSVRRRRVRRPASGLDCTALSGSSTWAPVTIYLIYSPGPYVQYHHRAPASDASGTARHPHHMHIATDTRHRTTGVRHMRDTLSRRRVQYNMTCACTQTTSTRHTMLDSKRRLQRNHRNRLYDCMIACPAAAIDRREPRRWSTTPCGHA